MSAAGNSNPRDLSPEAMARTLENLRAMNLPHGASNLTAAHLEAEKAAPRRSTAGRVMMAGGIILVSAALAVPVQHVLFGAPPATQAALDGGPSADRVSRPFEVAAAQAAAPAEDAPPQPRIEAAHAVDPVASESVTAEAPAVQEPVQAQVTTAVLVSSEPLPGAPPDAIPVADAPAPAVETLPEAALADIRLPEIAPPPALDLAVAEAALPAPPDVEVTIALPPDIETAVVEPLPGEAPLPDVVVAELPAPDAPVIEAALAEPAPAAVVAQAPAFDLPRLDPAFDSPETTGTTMIPRTPPEPRRTRTAALGAPAMSPAAPVHQAAPMPPVDVAKAPPETPEVDDGWLLARARGLVEQGDISGARLVLEHALTAGSRRAAFHLAETYDPRVLAQWRALGIRGDANRARELYARASESGVAGSQERLLGLK